MRGKVRKGIYNRDTTRRHTNQVGGTTWGGTAWGGTRANQEAGRKCEQEPLLSFLQKEIERRDKHAQDWLVWIVSVGCGAQGLLLLFPDLELKSLFLCWLLAGDTYIGRCQWPQQDSQPILLELAINNGEHYLKEWHSNDIKCRNQNIPVNKGKMSGACAFTFIGKVSCLPKAEWEAENYFCIFSYLGKVEKIVWSDKLHKWWKGGNPSRSGRKHSRHSSVLGMRRWEGVTCLRIWVEGAWQLGEWWRVPEGPEKTGRSCQLQVEALGQDA